MNCRTRADRYVGIGSSEHSGNDIHNPRQLDNGLLYVHKADEGLVVRKGTFVPLLKSPFGNWFPVLGKRFVVENFKFVVKLSKCMQGMLIA